MPHYPASSHPPPPLSPTRWRGAQVKGFISQFGTPGDPAWSAAHRGQFKSIKDDKQWMPIGKACGAKRKRGMNTCKRHRKGFISFAGRVRSALSTRGQTFILKKGGAGARRGSVLRRRRQWQGGRVWSFANKQKMRPPPSGLNLCGGWWYRWGRQLPVHADVLVPRRHGPRGPPSRGANLGPLTLKPR